jgi:hypothetical protein
MRTIAAQALQPALLARPQKQTAIFCPNCTSIHSGSPCSKESQSVTPPDTLLNELQQIKNRIVSMEHKLSTMDCKLLILVENLTNHS